MNTIVLDEGYFFGMGVFTTIAIENYRGIFLDRHLQRLQNSLDYFQIEKRVTKEDMLNYLEENPMKKGVLKVSVSPKNICYSTRENPYSQEDYSRGFALTYSEVMRNETSPFTYHKTLNCGENIKEKENAKAQGFDETLFLNSQGEITEGAVSNIFFVKNSGLFTPKRSCGLLPGIMRQYLMEHYNVTEMIIHPNIIETFDECFITNSLMGMMPIKSIDQTVFPLGDTAKSLQTTYLQKIQLIP